MRFAIGLRHGMIESASRFWQITPVAFEGAHKSFQFRTYRISTFRSFVSLRDIKDKGPSVKEAGRSCFDEAGALA